MSLNVLDTGSGRPLLALHGFTGTARTWSDQSAAWSSRHRVIAPDLLGHGGSDAPADPACYTLERQADGLATLLDLLGATPAAVVGYSMGARLSLVLALRHPATVERLLLESPSAGIEDGVARRKRRRADEALADDIERGGVAAFVERWEALPMFASQASLPADVRARLRSERLRHEARGLAASLRGAGQGAMTPVHDRLGEIDAPTLVVAGALDVPGAARARVVASGIPGARLEIIHGVGHAPHLEAAEAFADLSSDFLSTSPKTPTHAR